MGPGRAADVAWLSFAAVMGSVYVLLLARSGRGVTGGLLGPACMTLPPMALAAVLAGGNDRRRTRLYAALVVFLALGLLSGVTV